MFEPFPKIARLNREITVTEKIDGTNAQVFIRPLVEDDYENSNEFVIAHDTEKHLLMFAGSRTRYITPTDDNFGFASWVKANAEALWLLGEGRHYGEWWGGKIQRGYGLREKRFSLFNVARWNSQTTPSCCHVVPILYQGPYSEDAITHALEILREQGSIAAPGFPNPEGIVVWHDAARQLFKVTLEKDSEPKGKVA